MSPLPPNLPKCNPNARLFPKEWKESYFRRHYDAKIGGYICPSCGEVFRGPTGFKSLHADHIKPKSLGGLTVWDNMVLLCGPCNLKKGNCHERTQTPNRL
jgi:5-methylcytosine-specific restriction endonuclease McrA